LDFGIFPIPHLIKSVGAGTGKCDATVRRVFRLETDERRLVIRGIDEMIFIDQDSGMSA
jgi:hypothetical protein